MSNGVKIIRAMAYADGINPDCIFNDRLKDGKRSVKVWFWSKRDYNRAKAALAAIGIKSEIRRRPSPYNDRHRIWVG